MCLDRRHREIQLGRDLGVAQPAPDRQGDVALALGQALEPFLGAGSVRERSGGATCWIRRRVTDGDSIGSPSATRRIASRISGGRGVLEQEAVAPRRRARAARSRRRRTSSARSREVARGLPRSSTVAARPSRTGIRMSIRTTSGRSSRAAARPGLTVGAPRRPRVRRPGRRASGSGRTAPAGRRRRSGPRSSARFMPPTGSSRAAPTCLPRGVLRAGRRRARCAR